MMTDYLRRLLPLRLTLQAGHVARATLQVTDDDDDGNPELAAEFHAFGLSHRVPPREISLPDAANLAMGLLASITDLFPTKED